MTYVIGDVHGEFDSLRQLVNKLPKEAQLIFVGDLIDRGRKSKEVVDFVRTSNHKCIHGNHEEMMCDYATAFEHSYPNIPPMLHSWIRNGGKETLLSYGLIKIDQYDGKLICTEDDEKFKLFLSDAKWMRELPLYIQISNLKKDNKPIVVSHSPIANDWDCKNNYKYNYDSNKKKTLSRFSLWSRKNPTNDVPIFNIFGHTIQMSVELSTHYINVDTGCFYIKEGYGKLSAYCLETGDVVSY